MRVYRSEEDEAERTEQDGRSKRARLLRLEFYTLMHLHTYGSIECSAECLVDGRCALKDEQEVHGWRRSPQAEHCTCRRCVGGTAATIGARQECGRGLERFMSRLAGAAVLS